MFSFRATEGDARLGEGVEDGDDLPQRPAEPGEFADDQAVARLQGARQLVQPPALLGSLSGGCFCAYSRMARRWLLTSCCGVETRR